MCRCITRLTLAALAALILSAARPAAAQDYTFQTVDAPGKDFFAFPRLNFTWLGNNGLLTQQYFGSEPPVGYGHTALLRHGVWNIIDVPGSIFSGGTNPSSSGAVALTYAYADGNLHLAIWKHGRHTPLPDLPGYRLIGNGFNDLEIVTGEAVDSNGFSHGFVGNADGYTLFDYPGEDVVATVAIMLNNAGTVVGAYVRADGSEHGFRRDGDHYETIDVPDSIVGGPFAINENGEIAGWYADTAFNVHGFVLRKGVFTTVDVPGALVTAITFLNERQQISGTYLAADGSIHGFTATPIHGHK